MSDVLESENSKKNRILDSLRSHHNIMKSNENLNRMLLADMQKKIHTITQNNKASAFLTEEERQLLQNFESGITNLREMNNRIGQYIEGVNDLVNSSELEDYLEKFIDDSTNLAKNIVPIRKNVVELGTRLNAIISSQNAKLDEKYVNEPSEIPSPPTHKPPPIPSATSKPATSMSSLLNSEEDWLTENNVNKVKKRLAELIAINEVEPMVLKNLKEFWNTYKSLDEKSNERPKYRLNLFNIMHMPNWGMIETKPGDAFTGLTRSELAQKMKKATDDFRNAGLIGDTVNTLAEKVILKQMLYETSRVVKSKEDPLYKKEIDRKKRGLPTVYCIDGPPGTGKSTIGEELAKVLDLGFHKLALSGKDDPRLLLGYNPQFATPSPGVIAKAMIATGRERVLIMLDEAEKAKDPVIRALGELLEVNSTSYKDDCFETRINKQDATFILTTNQMDLLPTFVKSRVVKLYLPGYTDDQKVAILKRDYENFPKKAELIFEGFKFTSSDEADSEKDCYIIARDKNEDVIRFIVENYVTADGVRQAKSMLNDLMAAANAESLKHPDRIPITIDRSFVNQIFGEPNINIPKIKRLKTEFDSLYPKFYKQLEALKDALDVEDVRNPSNLASIKENLALYDHLKEILIKKQKDMIRALKNLEKNEENQEQINYHLKQLFELENEDLALVEARDLVYPRGKPLEDISRIPQLDTKNDKKVIRDYELDEEGIPVPRDDLKVPREEFKAISDDRRLDFNRPRTRESQKMPKLDTGGGWLNLFKSRVAKKIADPEVNLKLTVKSTTSITPKKFEQVCSEIDQEIKKIQQEFKTSTPIIPEDEALFEGLKMEKLKEDEFRMIRQDPRSVEEPKDILHVIRHDKRVEVISSDNDPLGDEKFAMVLTTKLFLESMGQKGFSIKNCEDRPQEALEFYLIGKSLGLNPRFEDQPKPKPGEKGQTEKAIVEGSFGDLTVLTGHGEEKTIRDLFYEVRNMNIKEGDIESIKKIKEYISAIKVLEEDVHRFRPT